MKRKPATSGVRSILGILYLSTALAGTFAVPNMAWAGCSPNPALATGATTCSGQESARLTVALNGANVVIEKDATLSAASMSSIIVTTTPPVSGGYTNTNTVLTINGKVTNGNDSAILVTTGSPLDNSFDYFTNNQTTITVGETGVISGPNGIDVTVNGYYPRNNVVLVNSGTISSSTGGYALRGNANATGRFESITNTETGVIGAISGQVGTLTNRGLIDGGTRSAFVDAPGPLQYYGQGTVGNSGTIRSNGSTATLAFTRAFNPGYFVENNGLIVNTGGGGAVSGQTWLALFNGADGIIRSNATAISADSYLDLRNEGTITGVGTAIASGGTINLINRGTINGDVVTITGNQFSASLIDNVGGTINGNLRLGAGNDVFVGDAGNFAKPIGTIRGLFDAGGGTDTLRFTFVKDTVLDSAITLPQSIEQLALLIGKSSTLTLSSNFVTSSTLAVGGGDEGFYNIQNRFVNNGTIATNGAALVAAGVGGIGFTNNGTIRATLASASEYAIDLGQISSFANNGTITAISGSGVRTFVDDAKNSGTITADQTAVLANSNFLNSGTIRSLQGIGLDLQNAARAYSTNSGVLEGARAGARVYYSTLVNSGTITSPRAGVEIGIVGQIRNLATGVINGGVAPSSQGFVTQGARIENAGTINGNVDFGAPIGQQTSNIFIALKGGIVNGDIQLGGGNDIFATSLVNTGTGQFAGLTGRVTGRGTETLRYIVDSDATTTVALSGIFGGLGYDLSKNARLTLSAIGTQTFGIGFSGTGSVDLTGDFRSGGASPILDLRQTSVQLATDGTTIPTSLDVVSRGTLSLQHIDPSVFAQPMVPLSDGYYGTGTKGRTRFTNAGTIVARDVSGSNYPASGQPMRAIVAGLNNIVVNRGAIMLDGATGISGGFVDASDSRLEIVNSGTISQIADAARSSAIAVGYANITNSGQIATGGTAVQFSYSQLVNSGAISSSAASAIGAVGYFGVGRIFNAQGGVVSGGAGFDAIHLSVGSGVANAGTINGNVSLADTNSSYIPYGSVFINRGGTLNGNLTFGQADDIFIALDGRTGITGTIQAGAGTDTFVSGYSRSTSVDLATTTTIPTGFERQGVSAIGQGTAVTVSSSPGFVSTPLLLIGDGTIVNRATISAAAPSATRNTVILGMPNFPNATIGFSAPLAFVNQGILGDGLAGDARSFVNEGVIAAPTGGVAVGLSPTNATGFTFRNSGIIGTAPVDPNRFDAPRGVAISQRGVIFAPTDSTTIENGGNVIGGLSVEAVTRDFNWTNTGRITAAGAYFNGAFLSVGQASYDGVVDLNADRAIIGNGGTLADGLMASIGAKALTFNNSGTIDRKGGNSFTTGTTLDAINLTQTAHYVGGTQGGLAKAVDQDNASFTNSGAINGQVTLSTYAATVDVTNSGTISTDPERLASTAFSLSTQSLGTQSVIFANRGTVSADSAGSSAVRVSATALTADERSLGFGVAPAKVANGQAASLQITNSGTIQADGGARYVPSTPSPYPGYPSFPHAFYTASALSIDVTSSGIGSVGIVNQAGGTISAAGATDTTGASSELVAVLSTLGSTAISITADNVSLDNAGIIGGAAGGSLPDGLLSRGNSVSSPYLYLAGAIQTFGSADTITNRGSGIIIGSIDLGEKDDVLANSGTITGDIAMGTGNDRVENYGTITGNVTLGAGDDIFVQWVGGLMNGTADAGEGTDAFTIDATGGGTIDGSRSSNRPSVKPAKSNRL